MLIHAVNLHSVTDLSLIIENKFMESRHSIVVEDNIHAWYSKCGAEDSGLDVVFHLYEINNDGRKFFDLNCANI